MKRECVRRFVSIRLGQLGFVVGRKPGYFIIAPVILSAILATGVLRLRYENDTEYLYTPTDGLGREERRIVETLFPMNLSENFDVSRANRLSPGAQIIIEAKNGKSIFDKDVFADIQLIDSMVQNLTIYYDNREWRYQEMCARNKKMCFENELLNYEYRLNDMLKERYYIDHPLMINTLTFKVFFSGAVLGDAKTDESGKVMSARAFRLLYFLQNEGAKKMERGHMWEEAVVKMMENARFQYVNIGYYTPLSLVMETERNFISVIPLFSAAIIIMLAFSSLICVTSDCVKSKPWSGVIVFFSFFIALVGAFGLTMHCGVEFIGLNLAACFLMLGIGMVNAFVFLAAWRRTDDKLTVPERMSMAYAEAGFSVTITSLTNCLYFCIGVITPFVSVRIFCTYTAVSFLFSYIYHITFFGGCMALCGYLEHRNLHSLVCFPTTPKSLIHDRRSCFKYFCTGGINPLDSDNPKDNQEPFMMKFFGKKLGKLLSRTSVKVSVILWFLIYLSLAFWGCTQMKEGFEWQNVARYDSYTVEFKNLRSKYFTKFPYQIQVVINQTLNYADPKVQEKIEETLSTMEDSKYMAGPQFTECWLRIYLRFLKDKRSQIFFLGYNMSRKEHFYRGIRKVFFRFLRDRFKHDIKFNKDFTEITATRFILQSLNTKDANDERDMMVELRNLAAKAPVPTQVFNLFFVFFDQYVRVKAVAVQAVGVAAAAVMLITFIFLNTSCAFWVTISIVSIEIGIVGYMSWWNVSLDGISLINIVQSIGFSVGYSVHVTYAYMSSKETDPNKRLRSALCFMGLPTVQGCMTIVIGIFILIFAPSYVYSVFFKSVFLAMIFGAIHGLVFLPVFLSLSDILSARIFSSKANGNGSPLPHIEATENDIPSNHEGKVTYSTCNTEPVCNASALLGDSLLRCKSSETYVDNEDFGHGIDATGESEDTSSLGFGNMNPSDIYPMNQISFTVFSCNGDFIRCKLRGHHHINTESSSADDENFQSEER